MSYSRCQFCSEMGLDFSKKHGMCVDCLIDRLGQAKIFNQGFDVVSRPKTQQTCIICFDFPVMATRRHLYCADCMVARLRTLGFLKGKKKLDMKPVYLFLEEDADDGQWERKRYFPCDICKRDNVRNTRKERICLDCLIDSLLLTPNFTQVERYVYSVE